MSKQDTLSASYDGSDDASYELLERIRRTATVFNEMRPGLEGFARALTKVPGMRIRLVWGTSYTDGKDIYIQPPLILGDVKGHALSLCDRRNGYGESMCKTCATRDLVLARLLHEIAHIAGESFAPVRDADRIWAARKLAGDNSELDAESVRKRIDAVIRRGEPWQSVSSIISPYLPGLVNIFEDIRVDTKMGKVRPGALRMRRADLIHRQEDGMMDFDSDGNETTQYFEELRPNSQLVVALYNAVMGCLVRSAFKPDIISVLETPEMASFIESLNDMKSARDSFAAAFRFYTLARKVGFYQDPEKDDMPSMPSDCEDDDAEQSSQESDDSSEESSQKDGADEEKSDDEDEPDDSRESDEVDESGDSDTDSDNIAGEDSDESESGNTGESGDENEQGETEDFDDNSDVGYDPSESSDESEESDIADTSSESDQADSEESDSSDESGESSGSDESGDPDESDPDHGTGEDGDSTEANSGEDESGSPSTSEGESSDSGESDSGAESTDDDADEGGRDAAQEGASDVDGESGSDSEETDSPDGGSGDGGAGSGNAGGEGSESEESDIDESNDEDSSDTESDHAPTDPLDDPDSDDGREEDFEAEPDGTGEEALDRQPIQVEAEDMGTPEQVSDDFESIAHQSQATQDKVDENVIKLLKDETSKLDSQIMAFDTVRRSMCGLRVSTKEHHYVTEQGVDVARAWHHRYPRKIASFSKVELGIEGDFNPNPAAVRMFVSRVRPIFDANKRSKQQRNLRSGDVSGAMIARRYPFGDDRMFQKKRRPAKRSYAVGIGIDLSMSTAGRNLMLLKQCALVMADSMDRLPGVKFAVWGHSAKWQLRPEDLYITDETPLYTHLYQAKEWSEPWQGKAREAVESFGPDAENCDGHTLEFYRKQLATRRETDKILFYFTDGRMPQANYDEELEVLQANLKLCKDQGIEVIGVGIGTDSPKDHGLDTVVVNDPSEVHLVSEKLEARLTR